MDGEEKKKAVAQKGRWVSQLGEIKVGLTFSTPSTPAESPPVPPPFPLLSLLPPPLLAANQ